MSLHVENCSNNFILIHIKRTIYFTQWLKYTMRRTTHVNRRYANAEQSLALLMTGPLWVALNWRREPSRYSSLCPPRNGSETALLAEQVKTPLFSVLMFICLNYLVHNYFFLFTKKSPSESFRHGYYNTLQCKI